MSWQLQEAKQRFSELVRKAESEGPQVVTRNGREVVVVVSAEEFHRTREPKMNFKEFLMPGPDFDLLDIERAEDMPREIDW
ncbi:MAG: type II toxin-antitoxin system prevent-host-death family antitoxin [Geodermatophilaceae bacterium]|jgi:prevent-host-death family protein|nr:type II toxin-antitoxin system prevent-host-death family antitoxin [Geodermatophilaceae bacterium]MDQ3465196.1 type II toxin-antitoxin system prevent-host-death family antitoxin [Actinomycetota bacterium]